MKKEQYIPSQGCIRCLGHLHNMEARSLIGSALRGPLRVTLREALRLVGANLPVRCRLRSILLRCYVMARSAVLCASIHHSHASVYTDARRMRAAPLARSLPLPRGQLTASPCHAKGAKGAPPPDSVCCTQSHAAETNQMLRPSLPEAARARLRPSQGLLFWNAFGVAVPANPDTRSARRRGHRRFCPNRKARTNLPRGLAVPANSGDRSGRRRGRLFLSPNRKTSKDSVRVRRLRCPRFPGV